LLSALQNLGNFCLGGNFWPFLCSDSEHRISQFYHHFEVHIIYGYLGTWT
jgi:hypothetical protein